MSEKFDLEGACFHIISNVGMARSCFIEAIDLALEGKTALAEEKIAEGQEFFLEGHKAHGSLIHEEAKGDAPVPTLLLIHAEDQLMSAETFQILAEKYIVLAQKIGIQNQ